MPQTTRDFVRKRWQHAGVSANDGWRSMVQEGPGLIKFWLVALLIGLAAGAATLGFRLVIAALQTRIYGTDDMTLASAAERLPWYWVLCVPIVGGLIVGLILHVFTPGGRVRSVSDVIQGAALRNGRVEIREGIASVAASLITLSSGGSTGREGPVVHIGAMISTWVSDRLKVDGITGRDLLGCAAAAAVSASFNAPIAGALFALEVILRHFAVRAFAPIVIASVAGTVVSRLEFGNMTEFLLPEANVLEFYVELPAFVLLGLVCGLVAVGLMKGIFWAEDFGNHLQERTGLPRWMRPMVAGAMLGCIAIFFPHIIGVGYETTSAALTGKLVFWGAVVFALVKAAAVAITIAGRMGGGVFSPSLMMGALTGLSFGLAATTLFPEVSGSETLYALAGMGAVAAAVLGAPISTTLIVFELTGDWQTGLAVMVAVSLSSAVAGRIINRSFFLTQLERRGVRLSAGPQAYVLGALTVRDVMKPLEGMREDNARDLISDGVYIDLHASLEQAFALFDSAGYDLIPVVTLKEEGEPELHGGLYQIDALRAFNRALAEIAREEHA